MADAQTATRNILVIEDSPSVRRLIEVCLRSPELELSLAETGIIGLEMAAAATPDLVILDIGLPGMDGWEVLRNLRARPETASTPVLVLTAHAQPEMATQAEEGGADAFMTKPFSPADLRVTISQLLHG